ncbi:50S ribosomal protein L11 methyltransferase [Desulfobacterales bacterium HSG16]|nr:50S ribosomal protein L11 methyltransferase [Desulfobacterales bacterium HSG16]
MKWIEVKVEFESCDNPLAIDMIANIFYDLRIQGVEIEGPEFEPDTDWADDSEPLPQTRAVKAWFPENKGLSTRCHELETQVLQLEKKMDVTTTVSYRQMDEEDWAHCWKDFFWPEKIGTRIVVKPSWRDYTSTSPDELVMEIDPGMAFGTGTHPTTSMCVRMIEDHMKEGSTFLDVGTGSGILMITAAMLGAKRLCGVDTDEVAIDVARKNLLKNKIEPNILSLFVASLVHGLQAEFDMVTANILSDVVMDLLDNVRDVMAENGILVCSGIIEENSDMIIKKMKTLNFDIIDMKTEQGWVAIAGKIKRKN